MPAGRYWDLQLVQNYVYPWATFGEEPMATGLKAAPDELIPIFDEKDINVVVVGGEANGYWQIMGANYRKSVSIDDWRSMTEPRRLTDLAHGGGCGCKLAPAVLHQILAKCQRRTVRQPAGRHRDR